MRFARLIGLMIASAAVLASAIESPVTRGELDAVIKRAEAALIGVLRLQAGVPRVVMGVKQTPETAKPASRAEALSAFNRLFELAKPKFKFTPKPIIVDAAKLSLPSDPSAKDHLIKLVRWGCIPPTGPISCGKKDALLPEELGDALGWFLCRIAELTHAPDIEYSPYLTPDGGHPTPTKSKNKDG